MTRRLASSTPTKRFAALLTIAFSTTFACGGSQSAPARSPSSETAHESSPPAAAQSPATGSAPHEEKDVLPWSLEDTQAAQEAPHAQPQLGPTEVPTAIANGRMLELRLNAAAVRAGPLNDIAENLVVALPTTPTLFSQGGLSTIGTLDQLYVGSEGTDARGFFVLAKAKGSSSEFERAATRAGRKHGTPLRWNTEAGVRHTVFRAGSLECATYFYLSRPSDDRAPNHCADNEGTTSSTKSRSA